MTIVAKFQCMVISFAFETNMPLKLKLYLLINKFCNSGVLVNVWDHMNINGGILVDNLMLICTFSCSPSLCTCMHATLLHYTLYTPCSTNATATATPRVRMCASGIIIIQSNLFITGTTEWYYILISYKKKKKKRTARVTTTWTCSSVCRTRSNNN